MSDLKKYIKNRKEKDSKFAFNYDSGYEDFKIGIIIKNARRNIGLTQEELAKKINTTKSAISRLENHADDIKLSTIKKVSKALGKNFKISIS